MDNKPDVLTSAAAVLTQNDQGAYTIPAAGLYPHQWLWDSCFIAIGLRHVDIERAQKEILSLLRGQWANGMLPHMIFAGDDLFRRDRNIWRSWLNPYAPDDIATSGITQPPVLAEAIVRIGEKLSRPERRTWYQQVYPALLAYHRWLYAERDPHGEGLVLQIHPYETGLDNTPPWISQLRQHNRPWWIAALEKLHADVLVNLVRRDTRRVPPGQRISNVEALLYYDTIRRLRRKQYNIDAILNRSLFAIEDLTFNCIFIRANSLLQRIARDIDQELPDEIKDRIKHTRSTLEQLWDAYSSQYYSRNFVTHKLIKEPTIATLMPLYAGSVTPERAAQLVKLLEDQQAFGPAYPIPTVPLSSSWFKARGYWQGSTWINTNWMIIDGLRRYGFNDHADALQESTIELVSRSGCYEYFSPLDGTPGGASDFSWTAALTIDLLATRARPKTPAAKEK
jgi:hypothetical protein